MPTLAALAWLALAQVLTALREGLLVRALLGPALVVSGVVVLTLALVGGQSTPVVAVSEPGWAQALEQADLTVVASADPRSLALAGEADLAVYAEAEQAVIFAAGAGSGAIRAEAALRDVLGASWRLRLPDLPAEEDPARRAPGRLLVFLLAALFTLYGVVFGAGAVIRDAAALEAERSLAVPAGLHVGARLVAAGGLLGGTLAISVALLHGLVGLQDAASWALHGALAAVVAVSVGLGLALGQAAFAVPLSRGLAVCTGLLGLGWGFPELMRWLPVSSLGALARGVPPSGFAVLLTGGVVAWAVSRGGEARG